MTDVVSPSDFSIFDIPHADFEANRADAIINVKHQLDNGGKYLFFMGRSGIGKTILLSQFVRKFSPDSIAIFVDPINEMSSSSNVIADDILRQISIYLDIDKPEVDYDDIKSELNRLYGKLSDKLISKRRTLYFVIDNVDCVDYKGKFSEDFYNILPLNRRGICFLFSESSGSYLAKLQSLKRRETVSYYVPLMTSGEVNEVFRGVNIGSIQDVMDFTGGIPESVGSLRRIVETRKDIDIRAIFQKYDTASAIIDEEWLINEANVNANPRIMSIIAYSPIPLSVVEISKALGISSEDVSKYISSINFLRLFSGKVRFSVDALKELALLKMIKYKGASSEDIINVINSRESVLERIRGSIRVHHLDNNHVGVIQSMSDDNVLQIFESCGSANELNREIDIAIDSAKKINKVVSIFRFNHLRTNICNVGNNKVLKSEIMCYISNGDFSSAFELARTARLKEDKLYFLVEVANALKEKSISIPDDVQKEVSDTFKEIDLKALDTEQLIKLSISLYPSFTDLSMMLIGAVDSNSNSGENKIDFAFTKFYVESLLKNEEGMDGLNLDEFSLSDERKQSLNKLNNFRSQVNPANILSKIAEVTNSPGEEIQAIRNLMSVSDKGIALDEALKRVVELIISTPNYNVNASVYSEITDFLKHASPSEKIDSALQMLDSQIGAAKDIGPTADFVSFQLNVAVYLYKHGKIVSNFTDVMNFVESDIKDPSVKLFSLLKLINACDSVGYDKYRGDLIGKKNELFSTMIKYSAQQFHTLKDSLVEEAHLNLGNALSFIRRVNTQSRRDSLTAYVLERYIERSESFDVQKMCELVRKIKNIDFYYSIYKTLISECEKLETLSEEQYSSLKKLKNRLYGSVWKCSAIVGLLKLDMKFNCSSKESRDAIIQEFFISWNNIDGDWNKINSGFNLHNIIRESFPEFAAQIRSKITELRRESKMPSNESKLTFVTSIDLAIRANNILVREGAALDLNFNSIIRYIEMVPARISKSLLYARLISSYQTNQKAKESKFLIETYVLKMINELADQPDSYEFIVCMDLVAPILFHYNQALCSELVSKIDDYDSRDRVISRIINYFYEKTLVCEPFKPLKNHKYDINDGDVVIIISLISKLTGDYQIFLEMKKLCKSIKDKGGAFPLTQRSSYKTKLEQIIEERLPCVHSIAHDGYKIAAKACTLTLGKSTKLDWSILIKKAGRVPNKSDVIYTKTIIVSLMPDEFFNERNSTLREILNDVEDFPTVLDRIELIEAIGEHCSHVDKKAVQKTLEQAFVLTASSEDEDIKLKRRAMVDACMDIDDNFAGKVSSLLAKNPEKNKVIDKRFKRQLQKKMYEEKFKSLTSESDAVDIIDQISDLSWNFLGRLNASSGGVYSKKSDLHNMLHGISKMDCSDSFGVYSYYIQSVGSKVRGIANARDDIQPIFDALIANLSLMTDLHQMKSSKIKAFDSDPSFSVIDDDSYAEGKVIEFISSWLSEIGNKHILITEPYFKLTDLKMIHECFSSMTEPRITILTNLDVYTELLSMSTGFSDVSEMMRNYWKSNISTDDVPFLDIIFAGTESSQSIPIHDRWWLEDGGSSGVSIGTSMNGVGNKISSISRLSSLKANDVLLSIGGYLTKKNYYSKDKERIIYKVVDLNG